MCCYDSDTELVKILLRNWYSLCMWGDAKPLRSKRIPIRQHAFSYWRVLLPLAIDSYMVILFHFYRLGSDEYLPLATYLTISQEMASTQTLHTSWLMEVLNQTSSFIVRINLEPHIRQRRIVILQSWEGVCWAIRTLWYYESCYTIEKSNVILPTSIILYLLSI
jgi:hypothetical protein